MKKIHIKNLIILEQFLLLCYIFISIIVFLSVVYLFYRKIKISYCFNPKLINNLYLCLNDEFSLKEYLNKKIIDSYILNLY